MGNENLEEKIYLLKTANKILGPYTIKQIIDQMWARKIHAFDEVKTPFTRWSFLRDDEALGKVFKDIVDSRANSEDAEDITTTLEKTAITVSNKLIKIKEASQITASLIERSSTIADYKDNVEDIELKGSSINVISVRSSYKKKNSNIRRTIYLLILLVSISLFGALLLEEHKQVQALSINSANWDRAHYLGDTKTILSMYDASTKYSIDVSYRFIEAFIAEDKFLEAEKVIANILSDTLPAKDRAKLINYNGVIELHRQNFETGIAKFKEALQLDPLFEEAQLNLVDGLLLVDDIQQAKAYLLEEVKMENAQPTAVYLKFETLFFDETFKPEDNAWLEEVFNQVAQPYDQKQEILILLGLLLLEKNYVNESLQIFQRALDVEPSFLGMNIQTQSLYHPKVVIQKTLVFLKRYEFKYTDNPYYLAVMAVLYHKTGTSIVAKKYLDQALRINPADMYLQSLLQVMEPKFEENKVMEKILSGQITLLEAKLASAHCLKLENYKCADDLWNYIFTIDPNSIEAITGKIELLIHKNLLPEAKQWLYRGLGFAPRYIPLRKIEMEKSL